MCRMYSPVVNFNAPLNTQFVRLITFYLCLPTVGPYWLRFGAQTSQSALGKKKAIDFLPLSAPARPTRMGHRQDARLGPGKWRKTHQTHNSSGVHFQPHFWPETRACVHVQEELQYYHITYCIHWPRQGIVRGTISDGDSTGSNEGL